MLGKDVENQAGPVEDGNLVAQLLFEFALMAGRQLVVKDHHVKTKRLLPCHEFLDFARANVARYVGRFQGLGHLAHNLEAGRVAQQGQFLQ